VAVDIQRDRDARMSQQLAHDLRVDPLGEQEGGTRVPEIVESRVRQPGPLLYRSEGGADPEVPSGRVLRRTARGAVGRPCGS
jgi:hypothetical protein